MFVSERMSADLITALPELKISAARKLMQDNSIRHLPVTDENGLLLGIVTDRDMRDALPSTLLKRDDDQEILGRIMDMPISAIMTEQPVTVFVYYTIQDALLVMRQNKVGALPVIDEQGCLRGIMSDRDLLSAFIDVMGIDEPGTLLCISAGDEQGQMKKVVDIISAEKISLGSVLVSKNMKQHKKAIFPYVLTNNVVNVKKRLLAAGFELLDPMQWYLDQLPRKTD